MEEGRGAPTEVNEEGAAEESAVVENSDEEGVDAVDPDEDVGVTSRQHPQVANVRMLPRGAVIANGSVEASWNGGSHPEPVCNVVLSVVRRADALVVGVLVAAVTAAGQSVWSTPHATVHL